MLEEKQQSITGKQRRTKSKWQFSKKEEACSKKHVETKSEASTKVINESTKCRVRRQQNYKATKQL